MLHGQSTGYDAEGRSHFFGALLGRSRIPGDKLARYDALSKCLTVGCACWTETVPF
jgi:hypothetical protein